MQFLVRFLIVTATVVVSYFAGRVHSMLQIRTLERSLATVERENRSLDRANTKMKTELEKVREELAGLKRQDEEINELVNHIQRLNKIIDRISNPARNEKEARKPNARVLRVDMKQLITGD